MILYCVLFFNLQVFVQGYSFSCPSSIPTISSVSSCPKNKQEWETAALRKQCEAIKQNCTESVNFQYHCLLNEQLDGTLEVCAPVYFLQGFCASYSIQKKQIVETYHDGYECLKYHGSEQCPLRYKSSEAYKYQRCYPYDVKNETRTTPTPPATTEATTVATAVANQNKECSSDDNTGVVVVIVILLVILSIVIHILIWRHREMILKKICKRESEREDGDDNAEETRPLNSAEILEKANQENEELKRKIEESCDSLAQEKKAGEEKLKQIQQLKDAHTKTEEKFQNSLAQEKKAGEEKSKQIQQLKDAHTKTEEKLQRTAVSEDEVEKLQKEIKSLNDSFTQEKKAGEEKSKKIQQLKDAHTKTEEKLQNSLTQEKKAGEEKSKQIQQLKDAHTKTEEKLQGKAVSEEEIEKLQEEIKSLKDSLTQEKKAGEEKLKELQQLKDAHTKTEEKLQNSLMQEKNAGEEKSQQIQQLKDAHTKTEEKLQKKLAEVNNESEKLKRKNEDQSESLIKAYDENEKLKREMDEQSARLTEVNKENDDLKRQIEEPDEKQVVKRKPAPQPPTDSSRENEKEDRPVDEPKKSSKSKPAPPPPPPT